MILGQSQHRRQEKQIQRRRAQQDPAPCAASLLVEGMAFHVTTVICLKSDINAE